MRAHCPQCQQTVGINCKFWSDNTIRGSWDRERCQSQANAAEYFRTTPTPHREA